MTGTITETPTRTYEDLTESEKRIMDLAVRESRRRGYCGEFGNIASISFEMSYEEIVDSDGFSCDGYNRQGFNSQGFNRYGYNAEGYDISGYNRDGFDKDGFNRYGMNKDGVDKDGRDQYRFDRHGYDAEGFAASGRTYERATREWFKAQAAKDPSEFVYNQHWDLRPERPVDQVVADPEIDNDEDDEDFSDNDD